MALFNYECDEVKRIIEEVSPNYPQLTTYEKEWIYFYKYEGTNQYHLTANIPCEAILEVPVVSTGEQTLQAINNY